MFLFITIIHGKYFAKAQNNVHNTAYIRYSVQVHF